MDLSNLSYEELTELEKKINEEKKVKQNDGKVFYKCELLDDRTYDVMKPRFPVEKYGAVNTPSPTFTAPTMAGCSLILKEA